VSFLFLGWNLLVYAEVLPGLKELNLRNSWNDHLRGTALQGLMGGSANCWIFFTMIGLAFLLPTSISFSLWIFWVLYMLQLLVMVWLGHGQSERSFPRDFYYTLNFRTSEGLGALLIFAGMVLYKCRKYLLCAFMPRSLDGLPGDERVELRVCSLIFLAGSLGIFMIIWLGMGAHPVYVAVVCLATLIMTIGLIRAVAEGGILSFQAYAGPFHLLRNVVGFSKSWSASSLFAPVMLYYAVLAMDIKTYIAPAFATSLKIRDDLRLKRASFHLALVLGVLGAGAIAVLLSIMMSYAQGADAMNSWFYRGLPRSFFGRVVAMQNYAPEASPVQTGWIVFGAVAMGALLYFRQFVFWLPHPIGMVMLTNPLVAAYWFSIMLGWLAKMLATKYGTKESYLRVRNFFIGLIAGELTIIALALLVSYVFGTRIPIDLNRPGA